MPTVLRLHRRQVAVRLIALCIVTLALPAACASETEPPPTTQPARILAAPAPASQGATAGDGIVGSSVGSIAPDFQVRLIDGSSVTSAALRKEGRPVFLFFFATWCPVCRSELRRMKDIYPEFADQVDFYMVGQDLSETLEEMERYRIQRGYPWPAAQPPRSMLLDLKVLQQSTKVAINAQGMITYRDGYRGGTDTVWRTVFQELASNE